MGSRFVLRFSRLRVSNKTTDPNYEQSCHEVTTENVTKCKSAATKRACSSDEAEQRLPPVLCDPCLNELDAPTKTAPVTLHVYDRLMKRSADSQQPFVHLGVEVHGIEFGYLNSGIRSFKPGSYDKRRHRGAMQIGCTEMHLVDVRDVIRLMREEFAGNRYRLIGHNCQTFAARFVERLGLGSDSIPESCTRFAKPWVVGGIDVMELLPTGPHGQCMGSEACESSNQAFCSHL